MKCDNRDFRARVSSVKAKPGVLFKGDAEDEESTSWPTDLAIDTWRLLVSASIAGSLQLLLAVETLTPVTADRAAEGGWHHRML